MNRKWKFIIGIFSLLFVLTACATFSNDESSGLGHGMDMHATIEESAEQMPEYDNQDSTEELGLSLGDKIIENAYLSYETIDFEDSLEFTENLIEEFEGYIEHLSRSQLQSMPSPRESGEYANMTIRIPNARLREFIDALNNHDTIFVTHQEIGQTDVTKVYRDNETRINILKEEESVLRDMLQEQGSLEDILQIRTRLSEVVTEREIFEDANQTYDEQIEYSTVNLDIRQTDRAGNRDFSGFWGRLRNSFADAFYSFIGVMQQLIINLVYLIPYLIVIGLVGGIGYFIWQKKRNN